MENTENTVQVQTNQQQIQLPNSSGVLAMGIISLVCFCCVPAGIISITLAIIALALGNKAIKLYNENPDKYTEKSFKNAKAGRVCGIIGIVLGSIWVVGIIIYISIVGFAFGALLSTLPWEMM